MVLIIFAGRMFLKFIKGFVLWMLIIQFIFSPVFFWFQKSKLQSETWEHILKSESIKTIEISLERFNASLLSNKKEIVLNQKLYDIVSSTICGNTVKLNVYEDTDEQELIQHIIDFLKVLKKIYVDGLLITTLEEQNIKFNLFYASFQYGLRFSLFVTSVFPKIPFPPPEFF